MPAAHAVALDLGSTRFKLGTIDATGCLIDIRTVPAPALSGTGLIREGQSEAYLRAIDALIKPIAGRSALPGSSPASTSGLPLGLVCQRSTFIIWDRHDGHALTPVVSWQDRRADDWCAAHTDIESLLISKTGLLLSPHYAGPKLAVMLAADPQLAARLQSGDALFGNLDAWLTWHWSGGTQHQTDVTMAARTAMFSIAASDWDDEMLAVFGVPRAALPKVTGSLQGSPVSVAGMELRGSIADQAAGVVAMLAPGITANSGCLINFGTGAFIMQPAAGPGDRIPGYLTGPVLASKQHGTRFAIEGTINGIGPAIESFGSGPTPLPATDTCPDAFMIPDSSGVGAPHWRADINLTLSPSAQGLAKAQQRLVCIEGLLFRVYEILLGLNNADLPEQILVSGGLAREPAIVDGLAALLDRPVRLLDEPEATLLGTARLVGGLSPYADPGFETITAGTCGRYLVDKFARWQAWCAEIYCSID
jgi:glycerol kinase